MNSSFPFILVMPSLRLCLFFPLHLPLCLICLPCKCGCCFHEHKQNLSHTFVPNQISWLKVRRALFRFENRSEYGSENNCKNSCDLCFLRFSTISNEVISLCIIEYCEIPKRYQNPVVYLLQSQPCMKRTPKKEALSTDDCSFQPTCCCATLMLCSTFLQAEIHASSQQLGN